MHASWKRNTALFLGSQALSLLGSSLVQYALLWQVTLQTRSSVMMTLYIVAGFLPTFILSPFAGVWADRYDRRKLIVLADAMIALVTLALAVVFTLRGTELWLFFLAAAIRSVGTAVQQPAVGALLPQLVPEDQLMRVNSIQGTLHSVNMLGAPALAGFLMSVAPLQVLFYIDVVTAALAIALVTLFVQVKPRPRAPEQEGASQLTEIQDGFRYIRGHAHLVPFFGYLGFIMVLITPAAFLTPLQTARSFGEEVWRLTAIEMVFSVGMMLGGAALAAWGGFSSRMRTMVTSNLIMGACTVALGVVPHFGVYLAAMGIFGVALPLYNTPAMVMLQERVEPAYLGRVFSVMTMLSTALMPMSMLFFGPLAEVVSIERLLQVTGVLVILLGLLTPLHRRLMSFGEPKSPPVQSQELAS
ncbi:transporter, major facilitator family [Myxococcus xanthus DK 1622]|uniref:Transporter, major facilitator family n=1 Tax=Myxococcus xanthus (strain DK1622) TaxID=246197 RepID=Q1D1Q4_MYXXD|nr:MULTISPECIES: MFS transporter [Myxococcus]ABF86760.1 transporter, major facilitator family [Myxococcus xanthus DK 1622]NOJ53658.1 MFS transporter [Myxococcus xanthus]QPM77751.1 MFS transporter [Myxococcus xanthus]QVW66819.1 MFS transporter [Myxococcus xanthus DZ2]QZZ52929.1 Enterobactin exporter EntS [Myxococcus xanthus]